MARRPKKTHQDRVREEEQQYRRQLGESLTDKQLAEQAEARAIALQKAALVAEIRRQRAVGEALDLQAALDAVRGGSLVLPAAIAQGDLSRVAMAEWVHNVLKLSDLGRNAPDLEVQLEAADRAAQRTHLMLELIAKNQAGNSYGGSRGYGNVGNVGNASTVIDAPSDTGLTREEKVALVRRHLKLAEGA